MFRTALGESTASLDSTLRSGQAAGMGRGGPALRARAAFVPSVPAVCPALQVHVCLPMCSGSLVAKNLPEPGVAALHTQKVLGGCAMLPPAPSSGAEPTLCPPGTPGARSSACPLGRCGAAMGSQPRPLSPGVPRSPTVRVPWRVVSFLGAGGGGHGPGPPAGSCLSCGPPGHWGTHTLERGPRHPWRVYRGPGGPALPLAGSPAPGLSRPSFLPAGHDSDSDSELSLDEQSSSYASSHSSDSEDDGAEAEGKWDPARGPVHSTPKGERAGAQWGATLQGGPRRWPFAPTRSTGQLCASLWDPHRKVSTKLVPLSVVSTRLPGVGVQWGRTLGS